MTLQLITNHSLFIVLSIREACRKLKDFWCCFLLYRTNCYISTRSETVPVSSVSSLSLYLNVFVIFWQFIAKKRKGNISFLLYWIFKWIDFATEQLMVCLGIKRTLALSLWSSHSLEKDWFSISQSKTIWKSLDFTTVVTCPQASSNNVVDLFERKMQFHIKL